MVELTKGSIVIQIKAFSRTPAMLPVADAAVNRHSTTIRAVFFNSFHFKVTVSAVSSFTGPSRPDFTSGASCFHSRQLVKL